ncbi:alcohol dehydrogenase [Capronia epimyces CBS 606.96]|uniref:Alcohol dehydrogenase n=1 Tax=Capronia epimyces CBS 606.96 TaxID=1182542 RepID=W9YTQ4_9EURO|nr:alcohol dehydrogenase [Capronia epimyces CBS 606.96]EXJ92641.1 alcohol dehydrogenase [Capronia epimyces CBS 606.96]
MAELSIPQTQIAAIVPEQGGPVEFDDNYPVSLPGEDEVLVRVLYTGVCQSDLNTKAGTATGADGLPITNIKLPHVGGHEGVGRVVALGPNLTPNETLQLGTLVGIRFASRDIDPKVVGPTLCAGVTAYKAVRNAGLKKGDWLTVIGAGGGLGHFAVQYGLALGAQVLGVDAGAEKQQFVESLGAKFLDFTKCRDLADEVRRSTAGGTHAVVVTSGHPRAFQKLGDMIRIGGSLCIAGIPPGDVHLDVIKGLKIQGNLVGSLEETLEAVEMVRVGKVKVHVKVRPFRDLPDVYGMLEKGDIAGRIVLQL